MMRVGCIFASLLLALPVLQASLRQGILSFQLKWVNWQEARSLCRQNNSDLLNIRNAKDLGAFLDDRGWIGLHRQDSSSQWKWSDGQENATFFYWEAGEPDENKHCVFKRPLTSLWTTMDCSVGRVFICRQETLILVKQNKTWEEALEHCRSLAGPGAFDLASLLTEDDHDYARERAQQASTAEVWTGLRYLGGEWLWVGGEPVQHDDTQSCLAHRCGVIEKETTASFGTRDCNQRRNFFCYRKALNP